MDFIQHNRNQEAEDTRDNHIPDHGDEHNHSKIEISIDQPDNDACHKTIGGTVDNAKQYFLKEPLHRLRERYLVMRELTDQDGHCLRTGVASHSGYNRHDRRKSDNLIDGALECLYRERSEKCRRKVDQEPWKPETDRLPEGCLEAFLRAYTGHLKHILIMLLNDDVDDIIYGDDSEKLFLRADNRNCLQIVSGYQLCDFLLIDLRSDIDHIVMHDITDQL